MEKSKKIIEKQKFFILAKLVWLYVIAIVSLFILYALLTVTFSKSDFLVDKISFPQISPDSNLPLIISIVFALLLIGLSTYFFFHLRKTLFERLNKMEEKIDQNTNEMMVSNERYRRTIDELSDAIHYVNKDLEFVFFNQAFHEWCRSLGIDTSNVIGSYLFEMFPFLTEKVKREYDEVLQTGETIVEKDVDFVDGVQIVTETHKIPVKSADEVIGVITIVRDITERIKDTEQLLYHSQLLDNMQGHIIATDMDGQITYVNQIASDAHQMGKSEIIGRPIEFIFGNEIDSPSRNEIFESIMRHGHWAGTHRIRNNGKEDLILDTKTWMMLDENDLPKGLVGTSMDITRQKDAEKSVVKQIKRLRALRTIDEAIISRYDLSAVLDVLLQQVTDLLAVDAACIMLYDADMRTLYSGSRRGFWTDALENVVLQWGEGLAGRAVTEGRMVHIHDVNSSDNTILDEKNFVNENFMDYCSIPLLVQDDLVGVLELFHRNSLDLEMEWVEFLKILGNQAAIAIHNSGLFNQLQDFNIELGQAYDTTLQGWARALELRDMETEGHSQRVTDLALAMAVMMGFIGDDLVHIRRGALLHDVGKMGVPDSILFKPGKLTKDEWDIMRQHTSYGYEMLYPIEFLRPALDIVQYHHERWDGSGYPNGLKGDEIPLSARIFAVIDVWDSLIHERPYKDAWPEKDTLEYIRSESGKHFDPAVVDLFLRMDSLRG